MSLVEKALDKLRHIQASASHVGTVPDASSNIGALVDVPDSVSARHLAIDRAALRAAGYYPDETQDRRFADEYRQIKRPLLTEAFASVPTAARSQRLVMMTSALPGEGKTFTSINLALSLAREKDTSVILVDGDVAKPHISRIFGVERERGLLDALSGTGAGIMPMILPTDVRGLSILPAGGVREGATELLSSSRMEQVCAQLLAQHPRVVVLFDSPPLLLSSEARVLANAVGQVVVVVRAGHTPRQALLEALELVPEERVVGLILNQGRHSILHGYYGYTYGSYDEQSGAS